MAGVGPVPKENARRRNEVDLSHLEGDEDVPDKLKKLRNRSNYSTFTQLWWDTWVASEQAESFKTTDWLRLQMLAPLVEGYIKKPGHYSLAEIRQNETLLGATVADRMRLRMKQKDDKGDQPDALPPDVADFMNFRKNA